MSEIVRDALMRLTMCARRECVICKYRETFSVEDCHSLQTRCMNIIANGLNREMDDE